MVKRKKLKVSDAKENSVVNMESMENDAYNNEEWVAVSNFQQNSFLGCFDSHSKYEYHPRCDAKIEFELLPIVTAVKEIGDAQLEYKKEEECIEVFTQNERVILKKEIAVLGWKNGIQTCLENSIYYDTKDRYRLGCLNKDGKLIIDFKYCIIEVVGKYIFAGYNGDYLCNTYQGLYDLYTANGDFLFGGFTQYHFYEKENMLACNWCGNWVDTSDVRGLNYEFNGQSGYWSLFDLSTKKYVSTNGEEYELPNWTEAEGIKSILPLRDGREYEIPIKTQILSYEILVCGERRKMPNLPIETLFIMGNHTNRDYPYIETTPVIPKDVSAPEPERTNCGIIPRQPNINNHINLEYHYILCDIHLFINESICWNNGEKHLFTECMDYNLTEKKPLENEDYKAKDIRNESYNCRFDYSDEGFIDPFDSPYYNDALDIDQQSPEFWDSI